MQNIVQYLRSKRKFTSILGQFSKLYMKNCITTSNFYGNFYATKSACLDPLEKRPKSTLFIGYLNLKKSYIKNKRADNLGANFEYNLLYRSHSTHFC